MKAKEKLGKVEQAISKVTDDIALMEEDETVRKYLDLKTKEKTLQEAREKLKKEIRDVTYHTCNHIYIKPTGKKTIWDQRCVKCGLGPRMSGTKPSVYTNIECDLELAQKVYKKIVEDSPDMDDTTIGFILKNTILEVQSRMDEENKKTSR